MDLADSPVDNLSEVAVLNEIRSVAKTGSCMHKPLLDAQLVVLKWIHDGHPTGHYDDGFEHRITARALEHLGLAKVRGHGNSWTPEITDGGKHYLEHGSYVVEDRASVRAPHQVPSTTTPVTECEPEGISIPAQRVSCQRKAEQLGLTIVAEYIEPSKSATEMTKRIAFQQMLERIRRARDVDYVIVCKLSRFAHNRIDDAVVMADLQTRGVELIASTESIDATPVGQPMHGILAAFNEYRSREECADIAYKMAHKAKNCGTLGRAPLGFLNVTENIDGRKINTVAVDTERAPFVQLAFELYATENYTY